MGTITPCLWFDTEGEEAATFYTSVFPNSRILEVARYPEGGPGEPGSAMTVSFRLEGQQFTGLNGGPHQAEIVTRNDDPVTVDGFVVVRRTINAWIYPWIYALLAVVLALNLLSLGWLIRRATRSRGDAIAPGKVRSARELKADRLSSQRR